jgi:hypothetical protein
MPMLIMDLLGVETDADVGTVGIEQGCQLPV